MASRAYKSQLILYDNDDGTQSLRHQQLAIKAGTTDTLVPITPSVTAREVATVYQYEGTNQNLRHLNLVIDDLEVRGVIPYGSIDTVSMSDCIREILDSSGVIVGRYIGESQSNGDTANNSI